MKGNNINKYTNKQIKNAYFRLTNNKSKDIKKDERIITSSELRVASCFSYAVHVLKDRFELGEKIIFKDNNFKNAYIKILLLKNPKHNKNKLVKDYIKEMNHKNVKNVLYL